MIKLGGRHVGGTAGLMTTKDPYQTDTVQLVKMRTEIRGIH